MVILSRGRDLVFRACFWRGRGVRFAEAHLAALKTWWRKSTGSFRTTTARTGRSSGPLLRIQSFRKSPDFVRVFPGHHTSLICFYRPPHTPPPLRSREPTTMAKDLGPGILRLEPVLAALTPPELEVASHSGDTVAGYGGNTRSPAKFEAETERVSRTRVEVAPL
jgi:hypothetical protein